MKAHRLARELGILDVDAMVDAITPEQYDNWNSYFQYEEPAFWEAMQLQTGRLAWATFQVKSPKKRLRETDYHFRLRGPNSAALLSAQMEAAAISSEIWEELKTNGQTDL